MSNAEVDEERERAIATLTEAFARDELELDALERSLTRVQNAETRAEIQTVVGDLQPATEPLPTTALVRAPAEPDPARPVLRIRGAAILGAVEITTRLPGESAWQAWWRARSKRKQLGGG